MKKRIKLLCCLLGLALLLPAAGLAATGDSVPTQDAWNLACDYKTSVDTAVYNALGDTQATLPAGSYISIEYPSSGEWQSVEYLMDGAVQSGKVKTSDLVSCISRVVSAQGKIVQVHELDPNHDTIVANNEVISLASGAQIKSDPNVAGSISAPGTTPAVTPATEDTVDVPADAPADVPVDAPTAAPAAPNTTDSLHITVAGVSVGESIVTPEPTPEPTPTPAPFDPGQATVEQLGVYMSKVSYNGETRDVLTAELSLSADVAEDKKLAVIYAPRSGKATLRGSASSNGKYVKKCTAGTVVSVLEVGEKFCKIDDKGKTGYMLTNCLDFQAPAAQIEGMAVLSIDGKTEGSSTVNIRSKADRDSAKVGAWKVGTELVALSHADGWYKVEANGKLGYVMDEFVTMK